MKCFVLITIQILASLVFCKAQNINEIKIGNQVWMSKNLNVDRFRNGELIPEAKSLEEWLNAGWNKKPVYCYYYFDSNNGKMYGKLYNWYAVNDDRGLAPEGWHIPSDSEWTILTDFLGDEQNVALKLKSKSGWIDNGNGNNQSNFSGLPTGLIYVECKGGDSEQGFYGLNKIGLWWTSSEYDADWLGNYTAWSRSLTFEDNSLNKLHYCKIAGLAVRCLKN